MCAKILVTCMIEVAMLENTAEAEPIDKELGVVVVGCLFSDDFFARYF